MALVLEANSSGRGGGGVFITFGLTIPGSLANSILIVGTSVQDSNHANLPVVAVQSDAQALAKIRSDEAAGNNRVEWWYKVAPTSGVRTIEVDVSGTVGEIAAYAFVFSGAKQTGVPDAQAGTTGNAQNPSIAITTASNNAYILTICSTEASITGTGGSGQTFLTALTDQSFENAVASYELLATAGTDTQLVNTGSGQSYAISTISIAEAVAVASNVINTWKRTGRPRPFAPGNAR